jgi:hypothetical protein
MIITIKEKKVKVFLSINMDNLPTITGSPLSFKNPCQTIIL